MSGLFATRNVPSRLHGQQRQSGEFPETLLCGGVGLFVNPSVCHCDKPNSTSNAGQCSTVALIGKWAAPVYVCVSTASNVPHGRGY
jgi:hypothetical protein